MGTKKAFVLRIDTDVLESVERWAADEFRSTNGQLEWIIVNALKKAGRERTKDKNKPGQPENQDG